MKTVIYINNDQIQIATQKGKDVTSKVVDLDLGTVLNGAIINSQAIIDKLKLMKKELKNVTVLISSSSVQVKQLELPAMAKKNLSTVIKSEFELASNDGYIFSGSILEKSKKSTTVLCVALQKELVKNYVNVFKKAGIRISRIDSLCGCIVKYAKQNQDLKDSSYITNVLSGHNMISVLFENGEYKLINRNRLLSELGTSAFVSEVYGKLSSMLQFNRSSEHTIQRSFYLGMSSEDIERLKLFAESDDVIISNLAEDSLFAQGNIACFGLSTVKQNSDFLAEYKNSSKAKVETPMIVRNISVCLLLTALMGVWYLTIFNTNYALEKKIEPINTYLNSASVQNDLARIDELNAEIEVYQAEIDEYKMILDYIKAGKVFDFEVLSISSEMVNINNLTYNIAGQTLQISGYSESMEINGDYVEMLRNSGLFSEVYYQTDSFLSVTDADEVTTETARFFITAHILEEGGEIDD